MRLTRLNTSLLGREVRPVSFKLQRNMSLLENRLLFLVVKFLHFSAEFLQILRPEEVKLGILIPGQDLFK